MPSRKVTRISVPAIQRDGRAVALMVECQDGENVPLLINVDDLRSAAFVPVLHFITRSAPFI